MTDDNRPNVESIHQKRLTGMGRRRFTKTLLGVGFGSSIAGYLTVEDVRAAADDEVPIVVGIETPDDDPSKEIPHKKYVPADWYNDYKHATDVFYNNRDSLLSINRVVGVWFEPGEYGGENAKITVEKRRDSGISTEQASESVPESVEGVPLEVTETGETTLHDCSDVADEPNHNTYDQGSSVPGGVIGRTGSGWGTISGRVYSTNDNQEYFMVSNHLYGGTGDDHEGDPLYHPTVSEDNIIGVVEEGHCYDDYALVDPQNGHNPARRYEDANPDESISGWFKRAGLSDLKAQGESIEKYGVRTGRTSGQIQSTDGATSYYGCRPKDGQLKWGNNDLFCDGDSGSLVYHAAPEDSGSGYVNNNIWICGMCNARTEQFGEYINEDFIWGPAAWKLNQEHGLKF